MKPPVSHLASALLAAGLLSCPLIAFNAHAAIPLATGSGVTVIPAPQGPFFDITTFGAVSGGPAVVNQTAINNAIVAAAAAGGGTVVIPAGDFKTYSIRLQSNVGLHFASKNSIIRAAVPGTGANQDGGFYDGWETNLWVGIQDEGHSHFKNSLIWGINISNVMISGPGLIDGGSVPNASGIITNVIPSNDPGEATVRTQSGSPAGANKAIAIEFGNDIIFSEFSIKNGGHFGVLGTGILGWTIDGIIIDGNRDAIDVDSSQNVTVRNSTFNSPNDDALVLKATFALGRIVELKNVLVENCTVSGYDAGSVIDGVYSRNDFNPTGRFKLGTEDTGGFNTVTVRNLLVDHSRGIALEAVDGAELANVVIDNVVMRDVYQEPIFIRLGDRGRVAVTGISSSETVSPSNNVRLDDTLFIMPNLTAKYGSFPTVRYIPSYNKNTTSSVGGGSNITIVNPTTPTRLNAFSVAPTDPLFANAVGAGFATIHDVSISNVTATDVDPRAPIEMVGLVGHPIQNVTLSNINIQFRGGLSLDHTVEQRQKSTSFTATLYQKAQSNANIGWLAGGGTNEASLPHIGWDASTNGWVADPYNVPETPRTYPEPGMFGISPAYGIYAKHVQGLSVDNVKVGYAVTDTRPAVVLDDVNGATFQNFTAPTEAGVPTFIAVTDTKKRDPVQEYVKEYPYQTTTVGNVTVPAGSTVQSVTINRPEPGTPPDSLYSLPTAPSTASPYSYAVTNANYVVPPTVYRPYFDPIGKMYGQMGTSPQLPVGLVAGQEGSTVQFAVNAHSPRTGVALAYSAQNLPVGASFDPSTRTLSWTPKYGQAGSYTMHFVVDDGVIPQNSDDVVLTIASRLLGDVNGDSVITCADLTMASAAVGKRTGQTGFNSAADLDGNGVIDIRDIAGIARLLPAGSHC